MKLNAILGESLIEKNEVFLRKKKRERETEVFFGGREKGRFFPFDFILLG